MPVTDPPETPDEDTIYGLDATTDSALESAHEAEIVGLHRGDVYYSDDDDEEEPHYLTAMLEDPYSLKLPFLAHSKSDPKAPFFLDLRPLRDTERMPRQKHYSSFISPSIYKYLEETVFRSYESGVSKAAYRTGEGTSEERARLLEIESAYYRDRMRAEISGDPPPEKPPHLKLAWDRKKLNPGPDDDESRTPKDQFWSSANLHSLHVCPLYLGRLPGDTRPASESDDPNLRFLPILAPNLGKKQIEEFERIPGVFLALWVSPNDNRRRVSGWRRATRVGPSVFRLEIYTRERVQELNRAKAEKKAEMEHRRQVRAEAKARGEIPPTFPKRVVEPTDPSILKSDPNGPPKSGFVSMSRKGRRYLDIGECDIIVAGDPDGIAYDSVGMESPDIQRALDRIDNELFIASKNFRQPKGKGGWGLTVETLSRVLERPSEEGGLVGLIRLPPSAESYFSTFDLTPRYKSQARKIRQARGRIPRDPRPDITYAVASPNGLLRICPSLRYLNHITPPGMGPLDFKLRAKTIRNGSDLVVTLTPDTTGRSDPYIVGGRLCAASTVPKRFKGTHTSKLFLAEPPMISLDPPAITMMFSPSNEPPDFEDGHFVLEDD